MGWLRNIERLLEDRLEGRGSHDPHVLEALRVAVRLALDDRLYPYGELILAPNQVLVPFRDERDVPKGFSEELGRRYAQALSERNCQVLSPVQVRTVSLSWDAEDIELNWMDDQERFAVGFLEGVEGPAAGGRWPIPAQGLLVGRGSDCDLRFGDPGMSRHHFHLEVLKENKVGLRDLQSRNGTRLGDKKLLKPVALRSGAIFGAGGSSFRVWPLQSLYERYVDFS